MYTLLAQLFLSTFLMAGAADKVFVQSQTTQLKQEPKPQSPNVGILGRGEELTILNRQGLWLQVQTAKNLSGWIPKLLTSSVKPMEQSQILKDTGNLDSNAKTARRRTTDYNVSAATRGLAAGSKHRPGDEVFRSNRQAVEELEKLSIPAEKIQKFKLEGQIGDQ